VPDEAVPKLIETIIRVNRTGKRGDGKIFVLPIEEAVRVRTNERGAAALA
jgi:nitrogen regulatory protein PII 2